MAEELARALERERDILQAIMDNSRAQIAYLDPQFRFVRVNPAYARASGRRTEELLGQDYFQLFPDDENQAIFERVRDTGQVVEYRARPFEYAGQPERGVTYWDWSLVPVKDASGWVQGLVLSLEDVTDHTLAERAARESEEKLARLFDVLPIGISVLDENRNVLRANSAISRILHLSADELLRGEFRKRSYLTGSGLPFPPHDFPSSRAFDEQRAVQDVEVGVVTEDGELIWTSVSAVPVALVDWKTVVVTADITERKRAEQALQRERDFSAAVLDTSGGLVVVLDREGRIVRFNRACERATGYTFDEAKGRAFWDLFLIPEDVEVAKAVFAQLQAGQAVPQAVENYWVARDGSRRWIAWSNTTLAGESGAVEYVIGTGIDMTEHRRLVESLEASELLFRSVVETANAAIVVANCHGRVTFWNRMAEGMFGRTSQEMIGEPLTHILPARFRARHTAGMRRVLATGETRLAGETVETIGIRKGGEEFPLELSLATWQTGEGRSFTAVMRDITQRKRSEEALREANQSLEALIKASPLAITAVDLNSNVKLWNPAAERIFGWTEAEVLGQPYPLIPAGKEKELWKFIDQTRAGRAVDGIETVRVKKDGTPIDVNVWTAPLYDAEGTMRLMMIVLADISERKRDEEALHQYAREQNALYSVASAITGTLEQAELLPLVLDAVLPALEADAGWVLLPGLLPTDPPRVVAQQGREEELLDTEPVLPMEACPMYPHLLPIEAAAQPGLVLNCAAPTAGRGAVSGIETLVCIPLCVGQSTLGVIKIGWRKPYGRLTQNKELLLSIARQVAVALNNAQLYEEARQVNRLRVLSELDQALAATLELKTLAEVTLRHISRHLDAPAASLLLLPPAHGRPRMELLAPPRGWEEVTSVGQDSSWWQGLVKCASERAEPTPFHLGEQGAWPALPPRQDGRAHALAVPIWREEGLLAVMVLNGRRADRPFSDEDQALAQVAADHAGQAMANAQLFQEVTRLLHEQEETRAHLVQVEKLGALGRLAATIAHEINNPLQAVDTSLTLLNEELKGERHPNKLDRYLDVAASELGRISTIVRRMRDYYRPAHERLQPTDVPGVLDSVLALSDSELQHRGIAVERMGDRDLPMVEANPDHLKQVFLNLILNAMDAMPSGGTLRIGTCLGQMQRAGGEWTQPAVRVEIGDTGQGMPPEIQAHLFEPFFTTKEQGTGLGLSISYRIVEAHNGQITVSSEAGAGTTFFIFIPVPATQEEPRRGQ